MGRSRTRSADDQAGTRARVDFATRLASRGYEIVTATGGETALDAAREHRPDLILLDLMMPKRDGFEACQLLKADPGL